MTEEDILSNLNKYKVTKCLDTYIKSDDTLLSEIKSIKEYRTIEELHKEIKSFLITNCYFVDNEKKVQKEINCVLSDLKGAKDKIKFIATTLKENNFDQQTVEKIKDWYLLPADKEQCVFCGNSNITDAMEKWRKFFNVEEIKKRDKLLANINGFSKDCATILSKGNLYDEIAPKTIKGVKTIKDILELLVKQINSNDYSNIDIKIENENDEVRDFVEKLKGIKCYMINKYFDKLEFLTSNDFALNNKRDELKKDLDSLMEKKGKIYSDRINNVIKKTWAE